MTQGGVEGLFIDFWVRFFTARQAEKAKSNMTLLRSCSKMEFNTGSRIVSRMGNDSDT
jgi:hypothetical protein